MFQIIRPLKTLYLRELSHLLRDRHTLIYSVAIPLFLYPLILFALFQAMALVKGWKERQVSKILAVGIEENSLWSHLLGRDARIQPVHLRLPAPPSSQQIRGLIQDKTIDAVLEVRRKGSGAESMDIALHYASGRDASATAHERLLELAGKFRDKLLLRKVQDLGESEALLSAVDYQEHDIASGERKANYILSLILPLLLVVILLMGSFYPALDATAGERERRTLETTLLAPVPKIYLILGKYLAVVTLGLLAFLLNLASMTFSLKHVLFQLKVHAFQISFTALAVILAAAVLLASLLGALMMLAGFFARSFKEGQAYMAPLYLLAILPVAVTLAPEVRLSPALIAVPVVNLTLVFREALQARFDAPMITLAVLISTVYSAAAIALSACFISREEFLLGEKGIHGRRPGRLRKNES